MRGLVQLLDGCLHPALASTAARGRLHALCARLASWSCGGFEVRLHDRERVDLQLYSPPGPLALPADAEGPVWRGLRRGSARWGRSGPVSIDGIWLAFDVCGTRTVGDEPSLTLCLRRRRQPSVGSLLELLGGLSGRRIDAATARSVRRCVALSPGRVSHLGLMCAREPAVVRVNLRDPTARSLTVLGRCLGGSTLLPAARLLGGLTDPTMRLTVALDVGPGGIRRGGIEHVARCPLRRERTAWEVWLGRLAARGISSAGTTNALQTWPGVSTPDTTGTGWPLHLARGDALLAPAARSLLIRRINHVKLEVPPDRPPEAKAYLLFRHVWVSHAMADRLYAGGV